jgi:Arc/MetJ-type ribon-helix-helix transcriptional regulator
MTIDIKPETEQLVREEIRSGHFDSVDELIVTAIHAWRERFGARTTARASKSRKHLVDILSEAPFAGSDLVIERQKDYPREIDL